MDNGKNVDGLITAMQRETDLIESCIAHIQTAVDVDEWAEKLAVKALEEYQPPRAMTLLEVMKWTKLPEDRRDPVFYLSKEGKCGRWIVNMGEADEIYQQVSHGHGECWTKRPVDTINR